MNWKGVRPADLVFYEIHVGTFTPEGTFEALIGVFPSWLSLGSRPSRSCPSASFPAIAAGAMTACFHTPFRIRMGAPRGLQSLTDACHGQGLAIFLDVVYNHFGPEGNVFADFGP